MDKQPIDTTKRPPLPNTSNTSKTTSKQPIYINMDPALGALFGLEPIVAERICGGETDIATGAKLTPMTGNGTEFECKLPFAIARKDRNGVVVGYSNYTSCTAAACGNVQEQASGGGSGANAASATYRCCSAEAVWTEMNWLECTSCPNTGATFKADGLQYVDEHLYNIQCSEMFTLKNENLRTEAGHFHTELQFSFSGT
jgi:hypothetical protein